MAEYCSEDRRDNGGGDAGVGPAKSAGTASYAAMCRTTDTSFGVCFHKRGGGDRSRLDFAPR